MPTIRDRQLSSVLSSFEAQRRTNPNLVVDGGGMIRLLAAVGDTWTRFESSLAADLSRPGITRAQQLDLVKRGMDSAEKADIETILDGNLVPLADDVKAFLTELVGRQPAVPTDGVLRITGTQAGGTLQGSAAAGVTVEAINLSSAPTKRLRLDDTFVLGRTDSSGRFSGQVSDLKEGDVVRVRTRDAQGNTSNWVTVRAGGVSAVDTRNAEVALFRLGLADKGNGTIDLTNINHGRPISEPGAQLVFINARTGERHALTLDDNGDIPAGSTLNGRTGDTFSVRASDGTNNRDFSVESGKITVAAPTGPGGTSGPDLPDPALHKDELNADGTPRFAIKRYSGPLFKDGVKPEDVKQGQIGNCYMPSALASLAQTHAQRLQEIIKDNGDGTYTVTLKEYDYRTRGFRDKDITVDGDLWSRSWGGPLYGASAGDTSESGMEMWWPVFEKAYAQFKGSYNAIGDGGVTSDLFEAVLGKPSSDLSLRYASPDEAWNKVKSAVDAGKPLSAGTYGKDEAARYTNTGVYANHSYSILGYEEKAGVKYVKMRNPWGESEPYPGDGKNDGIFMLKLDDFVKLYQTIYSVQ